MAREGLWCQQAEVPVPTLLLVLCDQASIPSLSDCQFPYLSNTHPSYFIPVLLMAQRRAEKQWSLGPPGSSPGLFSSVPGRCPLRGLAGLVTVDSRWTVDVEAQSSEAW